MSCQSSKKRKTMYSGKHWKLSFFHFFINDPANNHANDDDGNAPHENFIIKLFILKKPLGTVCS